MRVVWYDIHICFLFYLPLTSCFSSKRIHRTHAGILFGFECKTFWMESEPSIILINEVLIPKLEIIYQVQRYTI